MTWKTVANAGYIFEQDDLPQEEGLGVAGTFLRKFTENFAQICARFHSVVGQIPIEGERQIQSVVLPAMYKIADAVYVEQPVGRKRKLENRLGAGWIDYWVYYQEFVFLIELKLIWINSDQLPHIKSRIQGFWVRALQQLRAIPASEAKYLAMNPGKVLKIAMLIVPSVRWSSDPAKLPSFDTSQAADIHGKLIQALASKKPNWSCMWALSEHLQRAELDDGSYEMYPCVGIVTRLSTH